MAEVTIPDTADFVPLLSALIGKDLVVGGGDNAGDPAAISEFLMAFVDDEERPVMLAGGDAALAYFAGAALALLPKGRAEDAIASNERDDDLYENYFEIMNVLTRAVNDAGGPHVRLVPGSSVDPGAIPAATSGRTFDVTVDGYGAGALSFWLV